MTDQLKTIQDDLAFLRGMAEEGRSPSVLGGAILATAGLVYGGAGVAHWLVMTGRIAASDWAYPIIWLGATALFMVILSVLKARIGGARTLASRASAMAWAGVGCTIFALVGSVAIVSWRAQSAIPTLLFPSITLAIYGLGWMVAAAVSRKGWIWVTSIGSYLAALVLAWFCITPLVMLLFAAAMALLAVAPGIALMRGAPAAT
jgi:hypothetical protein